MNSSVRASEEAGCIALCKGTFEVCASLERIRKIARKIIRRKLRARQDAGGAVPRDGEDARGIAGDLTVWYAAEKEH